MSYFLWLLPLIVWGELYYLLYSVDKDWREVGLTTSLIWGTLVALGTEMLSLLHFVNQGGLVVLWGGVGILLGFQVWSQFSSQAQSGFSMPSLRMESLLKANLWGSVGVIGIVGVTALVCAPNTWDAMLYHMTRVVHWMQNESVANYPTHMPLQLKLPPKYCQPC